MNYNLTYKQKGLIKDIVEEIRAGELQDEFYVAWSMGGSEFVIKDYKGEKQFEGMSKNNLKALEEQGMLIIDDLVAGYTCTLMPLAEQVVDSDFGALTIPSAAISSLTQLQVDKTKLAQILYDHFNVEELGGLCSDVGGEFEDVPGNSKDSKSRQLVDYMARRDRLLALIITAVKERPNIDWSGLY